MNQNIFRVTTIAIFALMISIFLLNSGSLSAQEEGEGALDKSIFTMSEVTGQAIVETESATLGPGYLIQDFAAPENKNGEYRFDFAQGEANIIPMEELQLMQTAAFTVTYVGDWPTEAQDAFDYALAIWGSQIESVPEIVVQATWEPIQGNTLGFAGANNLAWNFTGAPQTNTLYPIALANALAGTDLSGSSPEIFASFNSNYADTFYYDTDQNPGFNEIDFITVVLHEVGHGLGFAGSVRGDTINQTATWGQIGFPYAYDLFTENNAGAGIISFTSGSGALYDQVTTDPIFFDGPQAGAENGGRVNLYAPDPWQQGSSYSHLDLAIFSGTDNQLMRPSLTRGFAFHNPGNVTLGIFEDMGWVITGTDPDPVMAGDVNCSDTLTTEDALLILQFGVGLRTSTDSCPIEPATEIYDAACDVNNNQACNTEDALLILQCNVGLNNVFCPAE